MIWGLIKIDASSHNFRSVLGRAITYSGSAQESTVCKFTGDH